MKIINYILSFFAGLGIGVFAFRQITKKALHTVISELVDNVVDDIYPCRLIATIRFEQPENRTIVDMSQYADKGIIGLTVDKTDVPINEKEEECDGEPTFYPTAVVYRMGEHWLWKVL